MGHAQFAVEVKENRAPLDRQIRMSVEIPDILQVLIVENEQRVPETEQEILTWLQK